MTEPLTSAGPVRRHRGMMGSANGRRAAGEQYLGGVTWALPAECLHEGPWVGNESGIEDRSGAWENRAPGLAPRTNCAKGGVASPSAGKGAAPQKHPTVIKGMKSKLCAKVRVKTPNQCEGGFDQ
jgi:hypothetical protein